MAKSIENDLPKSLMNVAQVDNLPTSLSKLQACGCGVLAIEFGWVDVLLMDFWWFDGFLMIG